MTTDQLKVFTCEKQCLWILMIVMNLWIGLALEHLKELFNLAREPVISAMKWFKHDSDAHRDAKLKKVKIKYGMQGYGLYWYCLELITSNIEKSNFTFELEHDAELIANDTSINYELVQEMMIYMTNLGLFENNDGTITCLKLARRLDQSMTSSKNLRAMVARVKGNHDGVMTLPDKVMQDKTRLDKTRLEEEESEQEPAKLIPPCPHQKIIKLFKEILPEAQVIRDWTPTRQKHLAARWKQHPDLESWETLFTQIRDSPFLMGRAPTPKGRKPFLLSLDWLCKAENFLKVIEGKYHD